MVRSRLWFLLAVVLVAGCSRSPSPDSAGTAEVSSARGIFRTVLPEGWKIDFTYRDNTPLGVGFYVTEGDRPRMVMFASATALHAYLGVDPANSDVYPFRRIQSVLPSIDLPSLRSGCRRVSIRPFEGGGFYGQTDTYEGCDASGGLAVADVVAIPAQRGAVVVASVAAENEQRAEQIAQDSVAHLDLNVDGLPTVIDSPPGVIPD